MVGRGQRHFQIALECNRTAAGGFCYEEVGNESNPMSATYENCMENVQFFSEAQGHSYVRLEKNLSYHVK